MMMMMCLIFDTSLAVAACADEALRKPEAMMPPSPTTELPTNRIHSLLGDNRTRSLVGRSASEFSYAVSGLIPSADAGWMLAATETVIPRARETAERSPYRSA